MRGWGLLNYQHLLESFGKNIFIRKQVFFSFRNKDVFKEVCFDFLFQITPHNWPKGSAYIFLHSRNPFWERFARCVLQTKNIGRFVVGESIYNHHSTSMSPTHHKTHLVTCCYMVDSVTPLRNKKLKNNINLSNWSSRQGEEIKIEPDEIKKPFLVSFLCKYLFLEVKISFPFYFFDYLKIFTDLGLQLIRLCRFVSRRRFSFYYTFFVINYPAVEGCKEPDSFKTNSVALPCALVNLSLYVLSSKLHSKIENFPSFDKQITWTVLYSRLTKHWQYLTRVGEKLSCIP